MKRLAAAALLLAACTGAEGTIAIGLTSAPGSTITADIAHARLTLSNPLTVVEADRGGDGHFALDIDVPADGVLGDLTFEGFDGAGARIAYGRTPSLPIAAVDFDLRIYVAAPGSLAAAPVAVDPPRTGIGTAAFPFGVLTAGGTTADGAVSDAVRIYDVFSHGWQDGLALPAPRTGLVVGASPSGYAYMFGGSNGTGAPTGTLWRFDTQTAPRGAYELLDDEPSLARSSGAIALVASEGFLVTGAPPLVVDGITHSVTAATTLPALAGTATSAVADLPTGGTGLFALFVGEGSGASGIVRVASTGTTDEPGAPASARRTGHGSVPDGTGRIITVGGAVGGVPVTSAIVASPSTQTYVEQADVLEVGRVGAAIAASNGLIVVAGGTDGAGAIVGSAEILDAVTLAHVATVPMVVPRTGAIARPLANGQVLILGGVDGTGAPVATIELFTPDP